MTDFEDPKLIDYRGWKKNSQLKRARTQIEWTPESIQEYKRCAADPKYFIEHHMRIVHGDHGLVKFKLRGYQNEMIDAIHNRSRVIMCMARQSGKTTAVVGYLLWFILFNENKTVAFLANKKETALELFGRAHFAYKYIPLFLQQGILEWNKGSIVLENGSKAVATATSVDAISGYTVNLLIIDETAKIEHWDEFSASVIPTVSAIKTAKIIQVSTPKGLNHFYKTWVDAQPNAKQPNGYYPIMVHWKEVPGRDEAWRINALQELNNDMDKFAQEYECEFMGSSGTLIAGWKLKELMASYATPIHEKDGLYKYVERVAKHEYTITVDVSEGKGFDYSAFHVVDVTVMPYNQVCVFRSNLIGPHEFAQILYNTAKTYNNAAVLIEYASLGPQVSDILFDKFDYENLLSTEAAGNKGKRVTTKGGKNIDQGIKMTVTVRTMGCSLLKLLIESNQLIVNDYNTINELATFSREEGKPKFEAEEGCHDDLVMAFVVFAWLSDQNYLSEITDINTISKLRDRDEKEIEQELVPFGFWEEPPPPVQVNPTGWVEKDRDDPDYPINF